MPLDKATLIIDLQGIFDFEATQNIDPTQSRVRIAQKMADAIEKYVKSGDGIYQPGHLVAGSSPVTQSSVGPVVKIQ